MAAEVRVATDLWIASTQIAVAFGTTLLAGITALLVWRTKKLGEETTKVAERTGCMASATVQLAGETSKAARAAAKEAEATEGQVAISAKTVEEIQRDRELAHLPVLSMAVSSARQAHSLIDPAENLAVRNAGGGVAIGVRLVQRQGDQALALAPPVDIPPGGVAPGFNLAEALTLPVHLELLEPPAGADDRWGRAHMALFCTDILGHRIRFAVIEQPDRVVYPAEIWRLGDPAAPPWVAYRRLWAS